MPMKKCLLLLAWTWIFIVEVTAQVGIGTTTPHPNAILDIKGSNKGLLIPRGDAAMRNALNSNNAKGLLMYDTMTNLIWLHIGNGSASGWQSLAIGTNYWKLTGALGTEIANTNPGGFWSANATTVLSDAGPVTPPVSGDGTRMMWIPAKSAFRAGTVDAGQWDAANIGNWSFAGGLNTIANRSYSFAMGAGTNAKGLASTSLGWFASATGDITTAIGFKTRARSYSSMSIGRWNDSIAVSNNSTWIKSDPLFIIGNGESEVLRHNTMVVYKNGNMILKNPQPFYFTKLPEDYPIPISGEGTRLMWLPEISAFRVGTVSDTAWDATNIGLASFGSGFNSMASGGASTAMGYETNASEFASTAIGYLTHASGEGATAMGAETLASGYNSTTLGFRTYSSSYCSVAMGRFNDSIVTSSNTEWIDADPLLILGNGTGADDLHNSMVVYKDGSLVSKSRLGVSVDPGVLPIPIEGGGTRLMWLPEKSAFRAGTVLSNQWDADNIGTWSFVFGVSSMATNIGSIALGKFANVTGIHSLSLGSYNDVTGDYSAALGSSNTAGSGGGAIAIGTGCKAKNNYSTAIGTAAIANGESSVSIGLGTNAKGFSSVVVGMYNDSILTINQNAIDPLTPLFIVGNGDGTGSGQRKNAMVVRKDGRVGIGTNIPATRLNAVGPAGNPTIPGITSTGIFRIALNNAEAIDMGKMDASPFAGWIQVGTDGTLADPLSLQPLGGKVSIGTSNPVASAVLEVSSTIGGFLPPRMTLANRNAISTPAAGLTIWCSNCGAYGQMQIFNGVFWSNLSGSPAVGVPFIGQVDGGGVIAYIFQVGDPGFVAGQVHGLIATPNDLGTGTDWGCNGTNVPGAAGTALGTGDQNTTDIVTGCATNGIAAKICDVSIIGGYSDWYLPSKDELNKLYLNRAAIGGFTGNWYWSSSEFNNNQAWVQDFGAATQGVQTKTFFYYVRAVRKF